MSLLIVEIPDNLQDRINYLESKLANPELSQLVAELQISHSAVGVTQSDSQPSLTEFLGTQREQVLNHGLQQFTEEQIRMLLRYPQLMWELQAVILEECKPYWLQKMQQGTTLLPLPTELLRPIQKTAITADILPAERKTHFTLRSWSLFLVTLAAVTLTIVGYQYWPTPVSSKWGFSQPHVFEQSLQPSAYLHHLADSAGAWFNKRPGTKIALAKRLSEFRVGCTELLAAPHNQLKPADRDWLRERCQKWIEKIDGHLADLQGDEKTFSVILLEADATIESLQTILRDKAQERIG